MHFALSNSLPCLCSFQAGPEADQLVNRSRCVKYSCAMSGSRRISAWVLKWSTHTSTGTHVASWPSKGLCDKVGPESSVMNASPCFYRHSVTCTAKKCRCILSNELPCLCSFQARPEADHESFKILLNISAPCQEAEESLHDDQVAVHMLQWPVYACSTMAQQRHMRQPDPNSHLANAPPCFQSLAQPPKVDESCPSICHASTLSRLDQSQINWWIVQDFVEYFCSMSGSRRISAWLPSCSTHASMASVGTHVASWPSRDLCCKMGSESHITNAPPRFYRDSVTGTGTKSRCTLSRHLPCVYSFQARPEVEWLLNCSGSCWVFVLVSLPRA